MAKQPVPESLPEKEPPSPYVGLGWGAMIAILMTIDAGQPNGDRYLALRRGNSPAWAGNLLVKQGWTRDRANILINLWIKIGLLTVCEFRTQKDRNDVLGLWVDPDRFAEIRAHAAEEGRRWQMRVVRHREDIQTREQWHVAMHRLWDCAGLGWQAQFLASVGATPIGGMPNPYAPRPSSSPPD